MTAHILITGSGRGIGAATAHLAAQQGYAVSINYRNDRAAAEKVMHDIEHDGGKAIVVQADISVEAEVKRLFDSAQSAFGPITALVNNAGMLASQMRVDQMDAARLQHVFATNVIGAFLCAAEAVRRMSTRHGGSGGAIVNVSSIAASLGSPGEFVDYAASKGAIDTLTIGLAKEVAAESIRVNAVRPGVIYTDIHASAGEPQRVDRIKSGVPMQRGGEAIEVARAILWLSSDEASYITGSLLDVAGGR
jgi:NAD(P)-dependent dehydrogenase (short-subunit alcohol dehydrogenase family)